MQSDTMEPKIPILMGEEPLIAEQNRNAAWSLWIGLGAILSLLSSCLLGRLLPDTGEIGLPLFLLVLLLLLSVILFFVGGRRDDRWYVVCSLVNHAGIGLVVLLLLRELELSVQTLNLALSGLPAGAVLFGTVVFYFNAQGAERKQFLVYGILALGLLTGLAIYRYAQAESGFWLSFGVCSLLGCSTLGALIWANGALGERSVCKGLAVASFSVYLLLLAILIVAVLVAAASSGSGSDSSRERKKSASKRSGLLDSGSRTVNSARSDRRAASSVTRSVRRSGGFYYPTYLWYYTPSTRYASIDRMEDLTEEEREGLRRRYRRQRAAVLILAAILVVVLIGVAVAAGLA